MKKLFIILLVLGSFSSVFSQSNLGDSAYVTFSYYIECDSARAYFGYPASNLYQSVKLLPTISADSTLLRGRTELDSVGDHYVEIRYYLQGSGTIHYYIDKWLNDAPSLIMAEVENLDGWSPTADTIPVNAVKISDSKVTANNLEYAFVDTNSAGKPRMRLGQLRLTAVDNDTSLIAKGSGTGYGAYYGAGNRLIAYGMLIHADSGIGYVTHSGYSDATRYSSGITGYPLYLLPTGSQYPLYLGGNYTIFGKLYGSVGSVEGKVTLVDTSAGDISYSANNGLVEGDSALYMRTDWANIKNKNTSANFSGTYILGAENVDYAAVSNFGTTAKAELEIECEDAITDKLVLVRGDSTFYMRTDWNNIKNPTTAQNFTQTRFHFADSLGEEISASCDFGDTLASLMAFRDSVLNAIADANKANFKADVSGLSTFDHTTDTVIYVDTVLNADVSITAIDSVRKVYMVDSLAQEIQATCAPIGSNTVIIWVKDNSDSTGVGRFVIDIEDSIGGGSQGYKLTNSAGVCTIGLNDGHYTIYIQAPRWTMDTSPVYLTATKDTSLTYYATAMVPSPPPPGDSLCVVYGYVYHKDASPYHNARIRIWADYTGVTYHGALIDMKTPAIAYTDTLGYFEFSETKSNVQGIYPNDVLWYNGKNNTKWWIEVTGTNGNKIYEHSFEIPIGDSYFIGEIFEK